MSQTNYTNDLRMYHNNLHPLQQQQDQQQHQQPSQAPHESGSVPPDRQPQPTNSTTNQPVDPNDPHMDDTLMLIEIEAELPHEVPVPHDGEFESEPPVAPSSAPPMHLRDPTYIPAQGETFRQQRRRFEQQETIWTRNRPPPVHERPEGEQQQDDEELEMQVDLFCGGEGQESTALPEGWYFDSKTQEFYPGDAVDYWSYEDGFLVRNHVLRGTHTFQAEEFPIPQDQLQTTTGLTLQRGSRQVYVNDSEPVQLGHDQWFGRTLYPLTEETAENRGQYYLGNFAQKLQNITRQFDAVVTSGQRKFPRSERASKNLQDELGRSFGLRGGQEG